jgi:hypothetical protein
MTSRLYDGTYKPTPPLAASSAPLLHEDELTRAGRILAKAAREAARNKRAAYVARHIAQLLASMER